MDQELLEIRELARHPGVRVREPARGDDHVGLDLALVALAREDQRVAPGRHVRDHVVALVAAERARARLDHDDLDRGQRRVEVLVVDDAADRARSLLSARDDGGEEVHDDDEAPAERAPRPDRIPKVHSGELGEGPVARDLGMKTRDGVWGTREGGMRRK
jgi:hypothetical protein